MIAEVHSIKILLSIKNIIILKLERINLPTYIKIDKFNLINNNFHIFCLFFSTLCFFQRYAYITIFY